MKKLPRLKLSYANVMATLALFVALGGVSYAAVQVPKNSVGTEQLKKSSVATGKVKDGAITGAKINLSTLGTVPSASKAETAAKAETAGKAETATTATKAETATTASHADSADSATSATNATHATSADEATSATNATNASHATSADEATNATTADSASDAAHATDADELGGVAADQYLTAGSVLPSGKTEVGVFVVAAGNGSRAVFAINFHLRLPGEVDENHLKRITDGTPTAECPGPRQAAPGYFCIYESFSYEMEFEFISSPFSGVLSSISPEGALIYWMSHHVGASARGSWAYTAA